MFVFVTMGFGSTVYNVVFLLGGGLFGVFFLFFKPSELCTAVDKDYTMFVLQCCYGSAYGFIWWKFAGKLKEVLCMHGKQT